MLWKCLTVQATNACTWSDLLDDSGLQRTATEPACSTSPATCTWPASRIHTPSSSGKLSAPRPAAQVQVGPQAALATDWEHCCYSCAAAIRNASCTKPEAFDTGASRAPIRGAGGWPLLRPQTAQTATTPPTPHQQSLQSLRLRALIHVPILSRCLCLAVTPYTGSTSVLWLAGSHHSAVLQARSVTPGTQFGAAQSQ